MIKAIEYKQFREHDRIIVILLSETSLEELREKVETSSKKYNVLLNGAHDGTKEIPFYIAGLCGYNYLIEDKRKIIDIGSYEMQVSFEDVAKFMIDFNYNKDSPRKKLKPTQNYIIYRNAGKEEVLKLDNLEIDKILELVQFIYSEDLVYRLYKPMRFLKNNKGQIVEVAKALKMMLENINQ